MRMREVDGPYFGGAECVGPFDNWRECNMHECPSKYFSFDVSCARKLNYDLQFEMAFL